MDRYGNSTSIVTLLRQRGQLKWMVIEGHNNCGIYEYLDRVEQARYLHMDETQMVATCSNCDRGISILTVACIEGKGGTISINSWLPMMLS